MTPALYRIHTTRGRTIDLLVLQATAAETSHLFALAVDAGDNIERVELLQLLRPDVPYSFKVSA